MPAPIGNQNARKWTFEKTDEILKYIEGFSQMPAMHFLGHALDMAGTHKAVWSDWKRIWAEDEDILDRMRVVEQRFENKLIEGALNRRYHAGIAGLMLKNNYGYTDRKPEKEKPAPAPDTYQAPTILVPEGTSSRYDRPPQVSLHLKTQTY
jgi:hypothetical protein